MSSAVNHPRHYNAHPSGIEAIDACELLGFNLGNALKYVFRADHKSARTQDIEKAAWYLRREAARCAVLSFVPRYDTDAVALVRRVLALEPVGSPLFVVCAVIVADWEGVAKFVARLRAAADALSALAAQGGT